MISHCGFGYLPPLISDVEYLFTYLLAVSLSSLKKCLSMSFARFFNWVVLFCCAIDVYEFLIYLGC